MTITFDVSLLFFSAPSAFLSLAISNLEFFLFLVAFSTFPFDVSILVLASSSNSMRTSPFAVEAAALKVGLFTLVLSPIKVSSTGKRGDNESLQTFNSSFGCAVSSIILRADENIFPISVSAVLMTS